MEFENAFSRPGKFMVLGKMAEVMEKSWNFVILVQIFHAEKWKYSPCMPPKG